MSADKAANNDVVVCQLHYINTLKQELNCTNAYEETSTDEKYVVNRRLNELRLKFSVGGGGLFRLLLGPPGLN